MQNSLWLSLGGRLGNMGASLGALGFSEYGLSSVDEVMQRDHYTLEDLLDLDEILQEAKFCNSQLLQFLSHQNVVEQLIRYTIAEPPDSSQEADTPPLHTVGSSSPSFSASVPAAEATTLSGIDENSTSFDSDDEPPTLRDDEDSKPIVYRNRHKFPYLCSELICGEINGTNGVIDVLVEDDSLLSLLFSLLDRPAPLDPSTVSYFRKVLQVLIQRKYVQLVSFCSRAGVLDKLLGHLGSYSVLELVIMIGWDSGWDTSVLGAAVDPSWMLHQGLIPKLVRKLHPRHAPMLDVHAHAGRLLVDVVVKASLQHAPPMVEHLQTTPVLQALFTHMFSGCPSSLSNTLSIAIVLVQRFANRRHEQIANFTDDDAQTTAQTAAVRAALMQEDDFAIAVGSSMPSIDDDGTTSMEDETTSDSKFTPEPSTHPDVIALGEPFISLLPHLPRILAILLPDTPAAAASPSSPPSSSVDTALAAPIPGVLGGASFGSLRMKVVELCLVLARSRSLLIDDLLSSLGVARTMLDVFFLYPWNNLLHGLVESIVTSALEDPDSALTWSFFADGLLVDAFINGWEANEEVVRKGGMRLGYMGHLIRTAATINHMLHGEQRDALLQDASGRWNWFITNQLSVELERQQSEEEVMMGGHEEHGLTSSVTQQDLQQSEYQDAFGGHGGSSANLYLSEDDDDEPSDDDLDLGFDTHDPMAGPTAEDEELHRAATHLGQLLLEDDEITRMAQLQQSQSSHPATEERALDEVVAASQMTLNEPTIPSDDIAVEELDSM